MMQNILVGLVAGVAAALLFVAPFGGTPLAIPLFVLTGLPIGIAGFGWGNLAALSAVGAGVVVSFAITSSSGAAVFAFLFAIPVAWATIAATQPTTTADGRGWRPIGRVLAHAAGALALGVLAIGLLVGFDPPTLTKEITDALVEWAASANTGPGTPPTAADVAPLVSLNVALMPATVAFMGLMMVAIDLYLAVKSVGLSDRLRRPTESLWAIELPRAVPAVFVATIFLAFAPGTVGYAAEAVAGALGGAVALEGLAVIHALSRGVTWRVPLLTVIYALVVLSGLPIILLALLGIAESAFHLRARRLKPPRPTST
jgi:hypothetical protein